MNGNTRYVTLNESSNYSYKIPLHVHIDSQLNITLTDGTLYKWF